MQAWTWIIKTNLSDWVIWTLNLVSLPNKSRQIAILAIFMPPDPHFGSLAGARSIFWLFCELFMGANSPLWLFHERQIAILAPWWFPNRHFWCSVFAKFAILAILWAPERHLAPLCHFGSLVVFRLLFLDIQRSPISPFRLFCERQIAILAILRAPDRHSGDFSLNLTLFFRF